MRPVERFWNDVFEEGHDVIFGLFDGLSCGLSAVGDAGYGAEESEGDQGAHEGEDLGEADVDGSMAGFGVGLVVVRGWEGHNWVYTVDISLYL